MFKVELHEARPLRWWYEQHLRKKIDMSPKYQRKAEIWSKWKRAHLIDSILNDFDIPKFYVANFFIGPSGLENSENKGYAIIDGKQRLGAIFAFFSDDVPLNPSFVVEDQPTLKLGKLYYSDIKSRYPLLAYKIDSFVPTVMNVLTDDVRRIEQLFVRLNMGEAATGAERRNAMGGPVPVIVRELSQHSFFLSKIRFDASRMQEHNLVIKLVLFEFKGALVDTKAKNLDDFAKTADTWSRSRPEDQQEGMGDYESARDRVYEVLELLSTEFENRDKLLTRSGEIPIYYWAARTHPTWVNELRDFVLAFSEAVLENMRRQRANPDLGDKELSAYYAMSRTSNDQGSLEGRYRIFEKRFKDFRKPGVPRRI